MHLKGFIFFPVKRKSLFSFLDIIIIIIFFFPPVCVCFYSLFLPYTNHFYELRASLSPAESFSDDSQKNMRKSVNFNPASKG